MAVVVAMPSVAAVVDVPSVVVDVRSVAADMAAVDTGATVVMAAAATATDFAVATGTVSAWASA